MNRRAFAAALALGTAVAAPPLARAGAGPVRNVVFVHGLFADGSCWMDVIARLRAAGINATSVRTR